MKKFLVLYNAPPAVVADLMKMTPEQSKKGMDEWMGWSGKAGKSVVDLGMPLGKTKRVTSSGMMDSKNDITGYTIVQADSADAAAKLFKDHPHLKSGKGVSIDVIESFEIPGM